MPLFNKRKLKPSWTLQAKPDEIIWKLLISPDGILTGEERNPEAKTSSLFAIDLRTAKVLWRGKQISEAWWFASEKATEEVLLIQTFQSPNLPEPKGIVALDMLTGEELWQSTEFTLLFANQGRCYASRLQYGIRSYVSIDIQTGKIFEDFGPSVTEIQRVMNEEPGLDSHSYYAQAVLPENEYFTQIESLVGSALNVTELRGPVEFLKFERYLIVSFHERVTDDPLAALQNLLQNQLLVIDTDSGEIIFKETLHRRTPLPLPDSFFVSHRTLLYVREKQTLAGIRLD